MDKRLIRVSKYLAKYLRHSPDELGLTLQPSGWVSVDDLLAAADDHGFPISYDEVVATGTPTPKPSSAAWTMMRRSRSRERQAPHSPL